MTPTVAAPARAALRGLLLIVAIGATACTTWHRAPAAPGVASPRLDHVRVTRADGRRYELWQARVVNDTLYGYARPRWGKAIPQIVAVPNDSVQVLEIRGVHGSRTVGLVAGVLALGAGALVLTVTLLIALVDAL